LLYYINEHRRFAFRDSNIEIVFLKQQAAKELGYLYEIWVYDKEGNILQTYN
jgi:hypothetical protein